jgi:hypothetical protein
VRQSTFDIFLSFSRFPLHRSNQKVDAIINQPPTTINHHTEELDIVPQTTVTITMHKSAVLLVSCLLPSASALSQVWNNVLTPPSCASLHQVASQSGLNHRLIDRRSTSSKEFQSPLEIALDDILKELGDDSPFCEYWCRQDWRHIEAHADVDEYSARKFPDQPYRFPDHAHVLYLSVGSEAGGPTCLFHDVSHGGQILDLPKIQMTSVPPVEGRLLRFDGSWLHTVPRPADLWTLSFVQGSMDYGPDFQRSVVLFNTWKEAPLEVHHLTQQIEDDASAANVNTRTDWETVDIADSSSSADERSKKTKIWLMGDTKRRQHKLRTVTMASNAEEIKQALTDPSQPSTITLETGEN